MLAMRFYGNRTQVEIATELGISQMHVSRLLSQALGWLREAMLSDARPPWIGRGDSILKKSKTSLSAVPCRKASRE